MTLSQNNNDIEPDYSNKNSDIGLTRPIFKDNINNNSFINNNLIFNSQLVNNNIYPNTNNLFWQYNLFNNNNILKNDLFNNNYDNSNNNRNIIFPNFLNIYPAFFTNIYFNPNYSKISENTNLINIPTSNSNIINNNTNLINIPTNNSNINTNTNLDNIPTNNSNRINKNTNLKKKKKHTGNANDNILRKIQVHFLTFVVNFINDVIAKLIVDKNAPHFKHLSYTIKKNIKHQNIEDLKKKTIGELLQLDISPKIKLSDKNINKNIYKTICVMCPSLKLYFQKNYIELFKEYFNNKNKIFLVNGKLIKISEKTKTFEDLMEKYKLYQEKLRNIAIKFFLNNYKKNKKPKFKTHIINK